MKTGLSPHVILISAKPDLYTSQRFITVGGDSVQLVSPLTSAEDIHGDSLLVIPRFSSFYRVPGLKLLHELEEEGAISLNASEKIFTFSDKWLAYQEFIKYRIPAVETSLDPCFFAREVYLVCKPRVSSSGIGISLDEITKIFRDFPYKENRYIYQKFIRESNQSDIRVLICGTEILGSYRRYSCNGNEFRSNISLGGNAEEYKLSSDELTLINQIIPICGKGFYGIDFIHTFDGPMVLEVNYCPGFEAFEQISGLVVAEQVLKVLKAM